ncbi:MAG TPA: carboxypeptidase-like regulatory domain-containing protein [Polyangiaceae bacterium]|nr:carboxypeptidase-like regulatory domain-containing protein [Polyangiaceae bacterium]
MKQLRIAHCLPWLLIAISPPLLNHCGGAVEHGTETGNPPVVEQQKLHVVLHEDGVLVVGDPGAVSPGASVSVTNTRSGARSEASAGSDGSVSVSVPGTLEDEYEVTVSSVGRSQTVRVSAAASGATNTGGLAATSCDGLEQLLRDQVDSEYTAASKACQVDSDCTTTGAVGCYYTCGGPISSVAGLQAAQRALLESTAPVCAELTSRCPGRGPPGCPLLFNTIACNDGTCGQLRCADFPKRIGQQISALLDEARDCTSDADCTLIPADVSCVDGCGPTSISVRADREAQLSSGIQDIDERLCTEFAQRPCPPLPAPPCLPPLPGLTRPVCNAGKCDSEFTPLP